jgi:hypothetical protein
MLIHGRLARGIIISFIQTQVLRLFLGWLWTPDHNCLDGLLQQPGVVHMGWRDHHG